MNIVGSRLLRTLILTAAVSFISACATPRYNYMPQKIEISAPPLGSINTTYVGDSMLRQGKFTEHDAIYLESDQKIDSSYTLKEGYYLKHGEDQSSEFYKPSRDVDSGYVDQAVTADPWESIQAYKDGKKLCVVTEFNIHICNPEALFKREKKLILRADSFQQTLIYSGKVGNKINVAYREFSNNLARPAFNNTVQYDLSESNIIGYKGARIEVIEATNEYIKFKVLFNFNKANF